MADTSPEKDALEERAWEAWAIVSGVAYRDRQHGLCFYDGGTKQMSWRTWQGARATPPSPSTAPEVPPFPESFGLADVPHAMNTPDDWDADYRATWQKLQVAEINLSQMRAYARKLRAALASRPAEVDDEGLPALPTAFVRIDMDDGSIWGQIQDEYWENEQQISLGIDDPLFTAEQYRQGQRDAVAADRARMPDPTEISDAITEAYNFAFAHKDWQATDYWRGLGKRFSAWAAPSRTTNKEGS